MSFASRTGEHQPARAASSILAFVIAGVTYAGVTVAEEPALVRGPEPAQRHHRASSWRTVVIPMAPDIVWGRTNVVMAVPSPIPAVRPPMTTASLSPPLAPAKPLVGIAHAMTGLASYYWQDQMTASGERFNKRAMTAAHKTLPLGTRVLVTNVRSGRTVIVRINDRGPFKPGRVIDLSEAAAEAIQMTAAGLAQVRIDVVR